MGSADGACRSVQTGLECRVLSWVLLAVWLVVIWHFGVSQVRVWTSQGGVLSWLLRKGIHLVVYGVLGALLAAAVGAGRTWGWVGSIGLLVAVADEVHQGSVPGRAFRIGDVGIDVVAAVLGGSLRGMFTSRRQPDGASPTAPRA